MYLDLGRFGVAPRVLFFVLSRGGGTSDSWGLGARRSRRLRLLNYVIYFKLSHRFISL